MGPRGRLVELPLLLGKATVRVAQVPISSQTRNHASDHAKKAGPVTLVGRRSPKPWLRSIAFRHSRVFAAIVGWCGWFHNLFWSRTLAASVARNVSFLQGAFAVRRRRVALTGLVASVHFSRLRSKHSQSRRQRNLGSCLLPLSRLMCVFGVRSWGSSSNAEQASESCPSLARIVTPLVSSSEIVRVSRGSGVQGTVCV